MISRFTNSWFIQGKRRFALLLASGAFISLPADTLALENDTYTSPAFYQQFVRGTVSDERGTISGVTVVVQGKLEVTTSTDEQGNFSIQAVPGDTLLFTAVGYGPKQGAVSGNSAAGSLARSAAQVDGGVVVGDGVQKKESLTGALQVVSGEELRDITNPSVENMLNSKVAGAFVAPGSGRPGSGGAVVIRGQATLNGTTSPLWVIDGVIVGSSAGDLNPDDIESMTVLKD